MSDYKPTSELMQLCARAGGPPVAVSEDLFRVLAAAQDLAERSDGAFDVTVGPVVRLWRRARRRHELPDPDRLAKALELVGCQKLRLDPKARTAELMKPGMLLDLGGIAKGYAADEALATLKRYGIESALVAGGGDIAVGSAPPGKAGWRIAIASLEPPGIANPKSKIQNLLLRDAAVSTSGDAEQHVEIGGVRYSHIVDPKTGMALTGRSSVTIVAPNCTTSDGLATAVSVLGPERGLELVKDTPGAGVLFVKEAAEGIRARTLNFPRVGERLHGAPGSRTGEP
jgi:thiamine biosynthesis lipoprotein